MRLWLGRILILCVLVMNIQCAVVFILTPALFAPGFELQGPVGEAMVRGMGVLFLMWNVPYAVAAWQPQKQRVSMIEALLMQAIGVVGETAIFLALPLEHAVVRASVLRFVIFDSGGLVFLLAAAWITRLPKS